MAEVISHAYTMTPDNPRALSAENFAEVLNKRGISAVATGGIGDALRRGKEKAKELDTALCCLGSLYTYVEVINEINK
jgi:dihydrofolate synthase/folylpolyglutamate synthase